MGRASRVVVVLAASALWVGGCGGYYILSVPDHVAPADSVAAVVAQLRRNDFFVLEPAVDNALLRFSIDGGSMQSAYTDKLGYASACLWTPAAPGRYRILVKHMDRDGEDVAEGAYLYAWEPARPVMAVDLDSLPKLGHPDLPAARTVLRRFAREGNVVYLTAQPLSRHDLAHGRIMTCDYPDGPVLLWRRGRWHIAGDTKLPSLAGSHLVSQLAEIKRVFPGLKAGLCSSALAEKAFVEAGLACTVVGRLPSTVAAGWCESWQALADRGR